jgi:hypothetical protein
MKHRALLITGYMKLCDLEYALEPVGRWAIGILAACGETPRAFGPAGSSALGASRLHFDRHRGSWMSPEATKAARVDLHEPTVLNGASNKFHSIS